MPPGEWPPEEGTIYPARLSSQRTFVRSMRAIAGAHPPSDAELDAMWQLASQGGGLQAMPGLLGYLDERRRHRRGAWSAR